MKRILPRLGAVLLTIAFAVGCAGAVIVRTAPPPPRTETRPRAPHARAVWIDGHWKWNGNKYVWKTGHWEKNPKGTWVPGHWKKSPRGHVWVNGHWKR